MGRWIEDAGLNPSAGSASIKGDDGGNVVMVGEGVG